jgi:hypothetical protein
LDTEGRKQPRRTEQKQEEAEDNCGQVEPATTQTILPEEGTLLRDQSFTRLFGRPRRNKGRRKMKNSETYDSSAIVREGQECTALFGRTRRNKGRRKKKNSETYDSAILGEGQERTALLAEAGQVQVAPPTTHHHRKLRGIMPNENSDDEESSDDSTMIPGAVHIPGVNGILDDEDDQNTLWTSTSLAPALLEAELAVDLDEAITLGVQNTLQQAVQATAVPVERKRWRILCGIASALLLVALVAIVTAMVMQQKPPIAPPSETSTEVPSETPAGSPSPTEDRIFPLQSFLASYLGEGFPMSVTERDALYWLAFNDTGMLAFNSQLLERYILVLFYFETGGDNWRYKTGWLSEDTICVWQGVACFYSDAIADIFLGEFL